jgi:chromosome partitioning protein
MIVIAVVNLKGGSAKSSTCYHMGGVLAKRGGKVLVVDDDPQSSLTQGFWGPRVLRDLPPGRTIAAVYDGSDPLPEHVIHPTGIDGLSILPGHEEAMAWNTPTASEWGDRPLAIRLLLHEVKSDYDYCLIDCPPNLHLCSFAALLAADFALVPLQAEDFGAQGMVAVNRAISQVQGQRGGVPVVLGYLLTMFDKRLGVHQAYAANLRGAYGDLVFATTVPYAKDFKESVAARTPISHFKKSGVARKAIEDLADEVGVRLAAAAAGRAA